jgi:hypothetical protein
MARAESLAAKRRACAATARLHSRPRPRQPKTKPTLVTAPRSMLVQVLPNKLIGLASGSWSHPWVCGVERELLTMRLADYVRTLERRYVKKFPGHEATIQQATQLSAHHLPARFSGRRPTNGSGR